MLLNWALTSAVSLASVPENCAEFSAAQPECTLHMLRSARFAIGLDIAAENANKQASPANLNAVRVSSTCSLL